MVHALRDARRTLVRKGVLVDLRPRSTVFSIDVVAGPHTEAVGKADASAGEADDRAADAAIQVEVNAGRLTPRSEARFEVHFYWDTTAGLLEYLRTGRRPKLLDRPGDEIEAKLQMIRAEAGPAARLRCTRQMSFASYGVDGCA